MENFIWFGNHLLNLAHVAHFAVDGTRVTVHLSNPLIKIDPLDGDEAKPILDELNSVTIGRLHRYEVPPIPKLNMNIDDEMSGINRGKIEAGSKP